MDPSASRDLTAASRLALYAVGSRISSSFWAFFLDGFAASLAA